MLVPDLDNDQSPFWMVLLAATAILFSFAMACGMPFAAVGALAALTLPLRDAALLAGLGWLANQAIGFGFLGYPLDAMTLAWGIVLGVSALVAVVAALLVLRGFKKINEALRVVVSFLAAWMAQQSTVFAASLVLGGTATAFAPAVIWFILWTNTLAFVFLLSIQVLGARFGVARSVLSQPLG